MSECQETWNVIPYDPANFWADNGAVWSVGGDEVPTYQWRLLGQDSMFLAVALGNSDFSGETNVLRVALPPGWRNRRTMGGSGICRAGAVEGPSRWLAIAGETSVMVFQGDPKLPWPVGTNTVDVAFVAHLNVEPVA